MFDDARSRRIIVISHCLLNQNAISDGTADFPGQFKEIIELLMAHHIGIIQLPCPELLCLGLDRKDVNGAKRPLLDENTRIRGLLGAAVCGTLLRSKAEEMATQLQDYQNHGFQILGVIGVNRSPSCGVETTSKDGEEKPGQGVFIEILSKTLLEKGITLRMLGTKTGEKEKSVEKVRQLLQL